MSNYKQSHYLPSIIDNLRAELNIQTRYTKYIAQAQTLQQIIALIKRQHVLSQFIQLQTLQAFLDQSSLHPVLKLLLGVQFDQIVEYLIID